MSGSVRISWSRGRTYFKADHGFYDRAWRKAKSKTYSSVSDAGNSYWDHITNAASIDAHDHNGNVVHSLLSAETQPENSSMIGFKAFAQEYPDKLFPLLNRLRPEFQELFIEYWLLGKSQSFIADCHGFIQTRTWQNLRIIEQTIGSLILLGTNPGVDILLPIIRKAGLESTPYGSLTNMMLYYASSQSYAVVAKKFAAPVPAIRKIFRPAIATLLANKDVKAVAVGAYLRSLTHQASLTGGGLSNSVKARLRRVRVRKFEAPAITTSPLFNFNKVTMLGDTPWIMLEISSEQRMTQITPLLEKQGKHVFGKTPAQIFAPVDSEGNLLLGYIFARSLRPTLAYSLRQIRGIAELSATRDEADRITKVITVPHSEMVPLINNETQNTVKVSRFHIGDFVEILTGDAAKYHGTVTAVQGLEIRISVQFPSGRVFNVVADPTAVKLLPNIPADKRTFWGPLPI